MADDKRDVGSGKDAETCLLACVVVAFSLVCVEGHLYCVGVVIESCVCVRERVSDTAAAAKVIMFACL